MQNDFIGAMKALEDAVRLKPDYVDAFYNLGLTLSTLCRFEEARGAYERAIELNKHYVSAYGNLGWVYVRLG